MELEGINQLIYEYTEEIFRPETSTLKGKDVVRIQILASDWPSRICCKQATEIQVLTSLPKRFDDTYKYIIDMPTLC